MESGVTLVSISRYAHVSEGLNSVESGLVYIGVADQDPVSEGLNSVESSRVRMSTEFWTRFQKD